MRYLSVYLFLCLLISSCATTNNLYIYDASPCEPEHYTLNAGIGSGFKPKFDSVSQSQHQLQYFPVLSFNGQLGLTTNLDKTNVRFSIWTPLFTSLGGRIGIQQSLFNHYSKLNTAVGFDLGYSLTSDSTKSSGYQINQHVFTSEIYMPFTYNFGSHSNLTITPKLTYTYFSFPITNSVGRNLNEFDHFKISSPGLTIGLTIDKLHIEGTVIKFLNNYVPSIGIAYLFHKD